MVTFAVLDTWSRVIVAIALFIPVVIEAVFLYRKRRDAAIQRRAQAEADRKTKGGEKSLLKMSNKVKIVIALLIVLFIVNIAVLLMVHPVQYLNMTEAQVEAQSERADLQLIDACRQNGGEPQAGFTQLYCSTGVPQVDLSWMKEPLRNSAYDLYYPIVFSLLILSAIMLGLMIPSIWSLNTPDPLVRKRK